MLFAQLTLTDTPYMLIFHTCYMMHYILFSCYSDASLIGWCCLHKAWTVSLFKASFHQCIVNRTLVWYDCCTAQSRFYWFHVSSCQSELIHASLHPWDTLSLMDCTVPSEETSSIKTLVLKQQPPYTQDYTTFCTLKAQRICHAHCNRFGVSGWCMPPPPWLVSHIPLQEHLLYFVDGTVILVISFTCFIHLNPPYSLLISPAFILFTHIQLQRRQCIYWVCPACWLEWYMTNNNVIFLLWHWLILILIWCSYSLFVEIIIIGWFLCRLLDILNSNDGLLEFRKGLQGRY